MLSTIRMEQESVDRAESQGMNPYHAPEGRFEVRVDPVEEGGRLVRRVAITLVLVSILVLMDALLVDGTRHIFPQLGAPLLTVVCS